MNADEKEEEGEEGEEEDACGRIEMEDEVVVTAAGED